MSSDVAEKPRGFLGLHQLEGDGAQHELEICFALLSLDSLAMPFLYFHPGQPQPSSQKDEASGREAVHYVLSIDRSRQLRFFSEFSPTTWTQVSYHIIALSSYARYAIDQSHSCFCRVSYELGTVLVHIPVRLP